MIKIHLSSYLYFGILENMKFWLAFRPRNESSKISFCSSCKSTCVQRQRPPRTGSASADSCCWVLLSCCIAADTSTESQGYSSPLSHPPPFLKNLYGIRRHSIVGALWKWKPFISDDVDPSLLLTAFFHLNMDKVFGADNSSWGRSVWNDPLALWESVKMDLWELQQWICGNTAFVFPGWRRIAFQVRRRTWRGWGSRAPASHRTCLPWWRR